MLRFQSIISIYENHSTLMNFVHALVLPALKGIAPNAQGLSVVRLKLNAQHYYHRFRPKIKDLPHRPDWSHYLGGGGHSNKKLHQKNPPKKLV